MNSNEKPRDYDYDIPEQAEEAWDKLANWYSARKKGSYEFKIQRAPIEQDGKPRAGFEPAANSLRGCRSTGLSHRGTSIK